MLEEIKKNNYVGVVGPKSKCTEDAVEKAQWYFYNHLELGDPVPTNGGLACHLMVTRPTLWNWEHGKHKDRETNKEFVFWKQMCDAKQERLASNGGITGELNAQICRLILLNHGYTEKQSVDHTSSDGSMTPTFASMYGKPEPESD